MRFLALVLMSVFVLGCNGESAKGVLSVKEALSLKGEKGAIAIAPGQHDAKLSLKNYRWDQESRTATKELQLELLAKKDKRKAVFVAPSSISLDYSSNGLVEAKKSGQPYDLAYQIKYDFKTLKTKQESDLCTWASETCRRTDETTGKEEEYECGISGYRDVTVSTGTETRDIQVSLRAEGTESEVAQYSAHVTNKATHRSVDSCCMHNGKCSPF